MPNHTQQRRAPTRSKTFTGCWTCRSRHVKCDEQKPKCQRCHNAHLHCQGYGVRLTWTETWRGGSEQPGSALLDVPLPRRRPINSGLSPRPSAPYFSQTQISTILSELEDCSRVDSPPSTHLFSVFSSRESTSPQHRRGSARAVDNSCPRANTVTPNPSPSAPDSLALSPGLAGSEIENTYQDSRPEWVVCETLESNGTQNIVPAEVHLQTSTDGSRSRTASITSLDNSVFASRGEETAEPCYGNVPLSEPPDMDALIDRGPPSLPLVVTARSSPTLNSTDSIAQHIDLLPIPARQLELLHHWVIFLCSNMLPVDRIDNPCRGFLLSMALVGLTSTSRETSGQIAIFHAICSTAAHSLFLLKHSQSYFDVLAVKHEQVALGHLQHGLSCGSQADQKSLLMAILACIASEAISGRRRLWRTHLIGGLSLLQQMTPNYDLSDRTYSYIVQNYLCLAALCNFAIPDELKTRLAVLPITDNFLEHYYGITRPLLQTLIAINAMAASKSALDPHQLDMLELQLYLNAPKKLELEAIDSRSAAVMQCVANVFYFAIIVYFKRSLRCACPSDVQDIVEKALDNVELADELAENSGGCNFAWPCIVIGSACEKPELQQRILDWSKRKRRLGFKNFDVACEVVVNMWQESASTVPSLTTRWQEVFLNTDCDIFPV